MIATLPARTGATDATRLDALLAGARFWPAEPQSIQDLGLPEPFVESLITKLLFASGSRVGRKIAAEICVPFTLVEPILDRLRNRRHISHSGSGPFNDFVYALTEEGCRRARSELEESAYVGPAPVPLSDYVNSVDAQAIADEPIRRADLLEAFRDVSLSPELFDLLGPAVNSASGLFLYGAPGNGKSTLARGLTKCFGQEIWLPAAFIEGRDIVKIFDAAYHHEVPVDEAEHAADGAYDRRWLRVRRPTVIVGGELTMDSLEINPNRTTNVSEAPLQLKSNCGCLLIDDFGRQRISPVDLLNRWIVPLENRRDFLTLPAGKKICVPFEQLIIFSTNLDPDDLVDEAFLRRIRYRIEVRDPDEAEFHALFQLAADQAGCSYNQTAVEHLLEKYYRPVQRPLRRCHPRDLLQQVRHYCTYNDLPFEMLAEFFDRVAPGFFTSVRPQLPRNRAERATHD